MEKHLEWLGWKVRDRVTGIEGTVSTIGVDLYGCVQGIVVAPATKDKEGKQTAGDLHWFDLTRLDKLGKKRVMERIMPRAEKVPGGYDKPTR